MLPYEDGFSLMEQNVFENIPVIFLTAKDSTMDKVKGLVVAGGRFFCYRAAQALHTSIRAPFGLSLCSLSPHEKSVRVSHGISGHSPQWLNPFP